MKMINLDGLIPGTKTVKFGYTSHCLKCGFEMTVYTQEDDHPEYYTDVFIPCPNQVFSEGFLWACSGVIAFELAVN
jgi:hypothetical protein